MARKTQKPSSQYGMPDDDIPEMTAEDFRRARPVADAMPELIEAARHARGRPKSENPLMQISIRIDGDVLAAFKAQGAGWQETMRAALRRAAVRLPRNKRKSPRSKAA
jgi:uncharacterized protein (DUF4415 family)